MKEEIIKKLNFMNMLYGAGRKEMFEEQWAELSKLINALPAPAFTLVTEMGGELGTEPLTLEALITKFNYKVENFGRMDSREDKVFLSEKDALDFIADGGGEEL
jgi:hypothetical protein